MSFENTIIELTQETKRASREVAKLSSLKKNQVLAKIAEALLENQSLIETENRKDLAAAIEKGLSKAMIDRLSLNPSRIREMAAAVREIIQLPDPIREVVKGFVRPNGLKVEQVRIPLGVIAMIYESRPNVTVDAAALCLKSGNAVILRGGSEAFYSNQVLGNVLRSVLKHFEIPEAAISVFPTQDHTALSFLLKQQGSIDLVIPRGGASLMQMISEECKIPVIRHDKGVCHLFVDRKADLEKAEKICLNAKLQRPGVCNALETLLVDEQIAHAFLPRMISELKRLGVEIRGCRKTAMIYPEISQATDQDWQTEYLDLILSVRVVTDLSEAIQHIERYGSLHTEAIVTESYSNAERFLEEVEASVVLVNASTRFNDGGQIGLGAEIGISTSKLHAFGPMGLESLTTLKYVVRGNGQVRE